MQQCCYDNIAAESAECASLDCRLLDKSVMVRKATISAFSKLVDVFASDAGSFTVSGRVLLADSVTTQLMKVLSAAPPSSLASPEMQQVRVPLHSRTGLC